MATDVPLVDFFENSTMAAMARLVTRTRILAAVGSLTSEKEEQKQSPENHNREEMEDEDEEDVIDWDECTAPPSLHLSDESRTIANDRDDTDIIPISRPPRTVVLTGATGFLGRALLDGLKSGPGVQRIICIGVRNMPPSPDPTTTTQATTTASSAGVVVEYHPGDLSLPDLGLAPATARAIFAAADAVVHNAADVSYLKPFAALSRPNVDATRDLVRLCFASDGRRGVVPLHYVSSGGACTFVVASPDADADADNDGDEEEKWPQQQQPQLREPVPVGPRSVSMHAPPTRRPPGYQASKWASEVLLERTAAAAAVEEGRAWDVYVHRPSNITREEGAAATTGDDLGKEAAEVKPGLDLLQNLLHYSRLLNAAPDLQGRIGGSLDSVSRQAVVEGVLGAVMKGEGERDDGEDDDESNGSQRGKQPTARVTFLHHLGGHEVPLEHLDEYMWPERKEVGGSTLGLGEWVLRAEMAGMHETVGAFFRALGNSPRRVVFPCLVP